MGSYDQLYVAEYPVFSSKSYVSPVAMTMFRESDKTVYQRRFCERNQIEWGHVKPKDNDFEIAVVYLAGTKEVRQRLDIIGFSLARAKREFNETKLLEIEKLKEWSDDDTHNIWKDTIEILENNEFEDFMVAYKTILNSKVHPIHYLKQHEDCSALIKYILKDNDEFYWGFPCKDIRCFFRTIVETAPDESQVKQDITDLVNAGYYDSGDEVCHIALQDMIGDYSISSKIIVLTEGSTDTEFLKESLKLLYPHLSDYYTFMDFGFKQPGGVGSLVNAVKSFAGAGIENRVIALFDNDTAAYSAVESLKNVRIPSNIVITHYPDVPLAKFYPALGPSGKSHQDINQLACGIELYLGRDVLEQDGDLIPIQWTGFDNRISRYQGEVLDKNIIQNRFREKIKRCSENIECTNSMMWEEMHQLFKHVFGLFSS